MKPWDLDEIRRAVKGKWLTRSVRQFNGHVATDSRKVGENELFFAIVGKTHDAHRFVPEVVARGAAVVIVSQEQPGEVIAAAQGKDVAIILVDDTVVALNRLAGAYRASPGMTATVIAVGGSNGKTTTKRIIHALLAEKFGGDHGHASPKSFNNNIGMPLTLLETEPSHNFVVLEIGTNAPGEIAALGEVCRPDVAVITSVGLEHLEKLSDLEGVAREEAAIANYLAERGALVIPAGVPELATALKSNKAQRITVGKKDGDGATAPDMAATEIVESMEGTTFGVNGRGSFTVPLLGQHNAINALMAIAVARRLGASDEQIAAGLAKVKPAEMRLEPMQVNGVEVLNDAYNANPSSMEAALVTFARLKSKSGGPVRKVVVLGDMLELGVASEGMHKEIGARVGAWRFDLFVAVGPMMHLAADVAAAAGVKVERYASTAAALKGLAKTQWVRAGDQVLLKGSRGMALETLLEAIGAGKETKSRKQEAAGVRI